MKWLSILIFLLPFIPVGGQEYFFRQMPTDYERDVQHLKILFQSHDQMLWLGTDKGLYSFDGTIYRFTARNDGLVKSVSAIAESPAGELWTGYEDGRIQILSAENHSRLLDSDSLNGIAISRILFPPEGDVYLSTYGAGLWKMHEQKLSRITTGELTNLHDIYDALMDENGGIWLGTDHGVWIYHPGQEKRLRNLSRGEGLPDEIVTELLISDQGDIWIGLYDYGFVKYNDKADSIVADLKMTEEDGSAVRIADGFNNAVWLGKGKSVYHAPAASEVNKIKLPEQIRDRIEDMLLDRTGNLWIASGNKLFMASTQFEFYFPDVKGIQAITSIGNKIWLGCQDGLFSLDLQGSHLKRHLAREELNILSLYHDPYGLLWIGTFGQGLYIFDPVTERSKHLTEQDGISNNSILNIDGMDNKVWLATLGGITEMQFAGNAMMNEPVIILFNEKFNFPAGYVYDVFARGSKPVWFGTDGKGLHNFDGMQLKPVAALTQFYNRDSFDLRTIYSITEDHQKNIWVSAAKGNILKLDGNGKITNHIPTAYGSLNSLVTSGQGEIVITREGAIEIYHPETGSTIFSTSTGLNSFSPNINSTAVDDDGSVWIADTDKILHYRSLSFDTSRYVHLHMVDVTPGSLHLSDPIRLRPDSNFLDFRFTGLWYGDPQSVRYRYKLEGHDKDWIYTQEGRAVYSKLSPGNYTFIVSASHNDDFGQSVPIRRDIVVLPPFYLTWWFILGVLVLVSFIIYRITRARIKRINHLHQLEKEKTTLQMLAIQAQVNPHFLFNSFNTLSGIIEEDQEAAVDYVDQLSSFFRGVLLHRNSELISLKEELQIMRNYTYILKRRYGDNIQINESIHSDEGYIAPLTLQLLIENAIKHNIVSDDKPLRIDLLVHDDWLSVSNPIKPKIQSLRESTGFGLDSLMTRYQYLTQKNIKIINDGNIFTVSIPIIQFNPQHEIIDR